MQSSRRTRRLRVTRSSNFTDSGRRTRPRLSREESEGQEQHYWCNNCVRVYDFSVPLPVANNHHCRECGNGILQLIPSVADLLNCRMLSSEHMLEQWINRTYGRNSEPGRDIGALIRTHTITSSDDPTLVCAVCTDQFEIDDEAKRLPCKHMYHPRCIIPWLSKHDTCPICRFKLPLKVGDSRMVAADRDSERAYALNAMAMVRLTFSQIRSEFNLPSY